MDAGVFKVERKACIERWCIDYTMIALLAEENVISFFEKNKQTLIWPFWGVFLGGGLFITSVPYTSLTLELRQSHISSSHEQWNDKVHRFDDVIMIVDTWYVAL